MQQIFKMSRGQKNYLMLITIKMGGNYMFEKYLWNGQGTTILYTKRQYTKKHVMTVKFFITRWMRKSQLIWYKYNYDVLSLESLNFKVL